MCGNFANCYTLVTYLLTVEELKRTVLQSDDCDWFKSIEKRRVKKLLWFGHLRRQNSLQSAPRCYFCAGLGHFIRDCVEGKKHSQKGDAGVVASASFNGDTSAPHGPTFGYT